MLDFSNGKIGCERLLGNVLCHPRLDRSQVTCYNQPLYALHLFVTGYTVLLQAHQLRNSNSSYSNFLNSLFLRIYPTREKNSCDFSRIRLKKDRGDVFLFNEKNVNENLFTLRNFCPCMSNMIPLNDTSNNPKLIEKVTPY